MNTSPVLKTAKKAPLDSQQNTANGNAQHRDLTADRPGEGVNCSCTPLFFHHSPVQQEEEEEEEQCVAKEPDDGGSLARRV